MKQVHPTYLSLVIATHREAEDCTAPLVVTGFGMFSVRKLDPDDWRFSLNASVVEATADEAALLIRLADALPMPEFLIGAHIEQRLFVPLIEAADRLPPPTGAYLGLRVARLRRALPVDVALGSGRRSAPLPYAEPTPLNPPIAVTIVEGKSVDRDDARARLEARALDNWLHFLRRPGSPRTNVAGVATLTWMASQGWKT
jgi:hypothetical protein